MYRLRAVGLSTSGMTIYSNEVIVTVTPPSIAVQCPSPVVEGYNVTCIVTLTGRFTSYYWTLDGTKVEGNDNRTTATATNIGLPPNGPNYKVKVIGLSAAGATVASNEFLVSVTPSSTNPNLNMGPFTINCPLYNEVGDNISCTAKSGTESIASGYWTLDGTKIEGSDDLITLTARNAPTVGIWGVRAVGYNLAGTLFNSNPFTIQVKAPVAGETIKPFASAEAGSVRVGSTWVAANLIDRDRGMMYSTPELTSTTNSGPQFAAGYFSSPQTVSHVKIGARTDMLGKTYGFPKRYNVCYRTADSTNWTCRGTFSTQPDATGIVTISIGTVTIIGLKVEPVEFGRDEDNRIIFQLSEIQAVLR